MVLKCIPTGMLDSNCYIVGDSGEGAIIDPGANEDDIMEEVGKAGLRIKYIILTHGHLDHIYSVDAVREKTGAAVAVHENDANALTDSRYNGSALFGMDVAFRKADKLLKDGDVLEVGRLKLEILSTPGHTPGGICIKAGNCVFTGDTLFRLSIGRTDFENGNYEDLMHSIKSKLMTLKDDTVVYPGHGRPSTIGYERRHNPFL